ncbi:MAG TPA: MFS transporter [Humisphaera sp.]
MSAPLPYAAPATTDVDRAYRYWRVRILGTTLVGYGLYYFVRTNIGVPLKAMGADLGYSKEQLGIILTVGGVTYGVSKFVNGFLGDHANPRYFMAAGLLACAAMNVCFGASSALVFLAGFWFANSWAQGMGFPPCAKSMAHWFSPRERSTTFGIWHTSHMFGAAFVSALTGYLVVHLGWRSCFYVPAAIATAGALFVLVFLRDTPGSLGLPPVEVYKREETAAELAAETRPDEPYWQVVRRYVLTNPWMWVISVANLLVYVLRSVLVSWGPTFLQEAKGASVVASGWLSFGSEIAGLVGALVAGLAADRVFGGRAGRVCVIAMVLMAGAIAAFWVAPPGAAWVSGGLFVLMGFCVYVPQMLIAAMAMNLGTKRAAAAAVGLTGIVAYASTIVTGWGLGRVTDQHGWAVAFGLMLGCTLATAALMAFTWNVGAHPQQQPGGTEH